MVRCKVCTVFLDSIVRLLCLDTLFAVSVFECMHLPHLHSCYANRTGNCLCMAAMQTDTPSLAHIPHISEPAGVVCHLGLVLPLADAWSCSPHHSWTPISWPRLEDLLELQKYRLVVHNNPLQLPPATASSLLGFFALQVHTSPHSPTYVPTCIGPCCPASPTGTTITTHPANIAVLLCNSPPTSTCTCHPATVPTSHVKVSQSQQL